MDRISRYLLLSAGVILGCYLGPLAQLVVELEALQLDEVCPDCDLGSKCKSGQRSSDELGSAAQTPHP